MEIATTVLSIIAIIISLLAFATNFLTYKKEYGKKLKIHCGMVSQIKDKNKIQYGFQFHLINLLKQPVYIHTIIFKTKSDGFIEILKPDVKEFPIKIEYQKEISISLNAEGILNYIDFVGEKKNKRVVFILRDSTYKEYRLNSQFTYKTLEEHIKKWINIYQSSKT